MDETTQSRASDAAANKKRRSSILKSQRPPRTPFSELEFNVATPTDTAKSRRVSFSRRTGVAEFVTNEATTTWKNFYEEHNKSLESSGNDSGAHSSKQALGHIGKRLFDQQFEEVEADLIGSLNPGFNYNTSITNINFGQATVLESTADIKLTSSQRQFELSNLTQTRVFGDDLTMPQMGENSQPIDINFSAINQLQEKDDLDEIQNEIKSNMNMICHGPSNDRQNLSEYIEVDLNSTHVTVRNYESDMSITDTIHSPKVQEVSKSVSIEKVPSKDWVTDKENIVVNPYVTPKESANFAINEEEDKVLVFDGKRLTLQSDEPANKIIPQRKTIVLNLHDDLPNFIENPHSSTLGYIDVADLKHNTVIDSDISITKSCEPQSSKTVFDDEIDISFTQAVPTNIVQEKRRTIVYENETGNISVTQAVPSNIIEKTDKTKTILYENDTGNLTITEVVPSNIAIQEKRKTIVYDDQDANVSMTQALPPNIITDSQKGTVEMADESGNLSMTQAIPNVIINDNEMPEKANLVHEDNSGFHVTKVSSIDSQTNSLRRQTVVFESDTGNISVTQAVPSNIILSRNNTQSDVGVAQSLPQKRQTIVFDDVEADVSMTQAVPLNKILPNIPSEIKKRATVVFDNDDADMSVTQAVSREMLPMLKNENAEVVEEKRLTIFDDADVFMTQAVDVNKVIPGLEEDSQNSENRLEIDNITEESPVIEEDNPVIQEDYDISMTEVPQTNLRKSITFDDEVLLLNESEVKLNEDIDILDVSMNDLPHKKTLNLVDSSVTKPIPSNLSNIQIDILEKSRDKKNLGEIQSNVSQVFVYQLASSSGQIQKGTEKGDSKSQPSVNLSTMDIDDEKLASTTNISNVNYSNDNQPMETVTKDGDIEQQPSTASATDDKSGKKSDDNVTSKSDIVSENLEPNTSFILSKNPSGTVTLYTGKTDAQSLSGSPSSPRSKISEQILLDSPKLTSQPPSTCIIKSSSKESDIRPKLKNSLLNELLDMSQTSPEEVGETNTKGERLLDSADTQEAASSNGQPLSNDRLFYITKHEEMNQDPEKITPPISIHDCETYSSINKSLPNENQDLKANHLKKNPHLSLEYKEENSIANELELQKKLALLQTVYLDKHLPEKTKPNESLVHEEDEVILKDINLSKCNKKFKLANDTKELLEMLSDLTGKVSSPTLDPHLEEDEADPEPVMIKGHIALENKVKAETEPEPRRISFLPQRRSIVISREDLLNNISMAGAALQKSRLDLDYTDSIDESTITESPEQNLSRKKAVRMSDEIVKTLKFDEDSMTETNNTTPLKKTAFGETTYMTEPKSKVIPNYLENVPTELKELMNDLVKPMADTLPLENSVPDNRAMKMASTCSINLQANLITSSQIDINTELYSNTCSSIEFNKNSSVDIIEDAVKRSITRGLISPIKSVTVTSPESNKTMNLGVAPTRVPDTSDNKTILIFDHDNPLNNVLLFPPVVGDVHKYNPGQSSETETIAKPQNQSHETLTSERSASVQISLPTVSSDIVSTQMNVQNHNSTYHRAMTNANIVKTDSEMSKPLSVDQCVDTIRTGMENRDVNTIIAMKGNKELLEASSSLTLVDGPLEREKYWSNLENDPESQKSNIKLLYKVEAEPGMLIDSDMTSIHSRQSNSKKRVYSPAFGEKHKNCTLSSLDLTPKPVSKMQKISESPIKKEAKTPEKDSRKSHEPKRRTKSPKKLNTTVMVQQVITEYDITTKSPERIERIREALSPKTVSIREPRSVSNSAFQSPDVVSSFTSSKNFREDRSVETSAGWQDPEPNRPGDFISDSESSTNIVAKLDMLPFMGTHECEWEESTGKLWSFRLLHSCIRLTVKLGHLHERALKTCVRADTPVEDVQLESLHEEKKNSVAMLCVSYAAEAMRYEVSNGCRRAGEVPSVLRRCARVARLATHWARAMHDMRARLAFTLTPEGLLSLKVANIPLRSVWEIHMKLELLVTSANAAPWPRASLLSVNRVLTHTHVNVNEIKHVLRDIPHDWGHAPRTIWRIFKYLKNKRDFDILGMDH